MVSGGAIRRRGKGTTFAASTRGKEKIEIQHSHAKKTLFKLTCRMPPLWKSPGGGGGPRHLGGRERRFDVISPAGTRKSGVTKGRKREGGGLS